MNTRAIHVAVLGSTGSSGRSTLEVIAGSAGRCVAVGLSAHTRLEVAWDQAARHRPRWLVATDPATAARFATAPLPSETELLTGPDALAWMVARPEVDVVVAAIVGSAGLQGTWAALEAGKRVALANKETLVMAGPLVMALAAQRGARLVPVDSEHSAIWQAMSGGRRDEVKRVILTASGGPCRDLNCAALQEVTVAQALAHPTWAMGPKISIDSATMMNKALEIIEARWLFDLQPEQIEVVIHPQSIVHSLVEFQDGSVLAQLSPPDMKLPIQYALNYPDRIEGVAQRFDWAQTLRLDFFPPDPERFPALALGHEVARTGGSAGAVVNAANEAAVHEFLAGRIRFTDIVSASRAVLEHHHFDPNPTLGELVRLDTWARQEVLRWVCR
jgi:1-deoxy-D-xylulose-5-phosphate reductoisomerase